MEAASSSDKSVSRIHISGHSVPSQKAYIFLSNAVRASNLYKGLKTEGSSLWDYVAESCKMFGWTFRALMAPNGPAHKWWMWTQHEWRKWFWKTIIRYVSSTQEFSEIRALGISRASIFVAKVWKATITFVMSVWLSVCLLAWNKSIPIRRVFMKFHISVFFENLSRKFGFH